MKRNLFALLFGKGFKTARFKTKARLAVSRLTVVKSQHQARSSIARADVVEFLKNGNVDRALIRVEQVMKEQNMLDLYVLLESYCNLLMDRVNLIKQEKICPEEIKEAVTSLIYAATRCGELPELKDIRKIFTSWYGREFATRAIELRNNCGVDVKIVQKLSTRMPSVVERVKVIRQIASDDNLPLLIEDSTSDTIMEYKDSEKESREIKSEKNQHIEKGDDFTDSTKIRSKYKDVSDAAEEAYELAAYAALAAKAALELSRSDSKDPGGHGSHDLHSGNKLLVGFEPVKRKIDDQNRKDSAEEKQMTIDLKFEKTHQIQNCDLRVMKKIVTDEIHTNRFISSCSDSEEDTEDMNMLRDEEGEKGSPERELVFYDIDGKNKQKSNIQWTSNRPMDADEEENVSVHKGMKLSEDLPEDIASKARTRSRDPLTTNRRAVSVRTRSAHVNPRTNQKNCTVN